MRSLVVLISILLALAACKGKENAAAGGEATETIAPAKPQPEATGTDAMTQTVELGDGRSVSEGGALAEGDAVPTDTASATATTTATTTVSSPAPTTTTR
jgi:ABC-type Fe3+-hydroxamate transport system substrate-binding protein